MLPAPSTFHLIVTTCPTSTHTHSMVITQYLSPISRTIKYIYVKIKQVIQNVNFHTVQIFKTNSSVVQVITKSRCLRVSFSSSNGIISLLDICHACPMENISNKHTRCAEPAKQRTRVGQKAWKRMRSASPRVSLSLSFYLSLVNFNYTRTWKGTPPSSARWNKRGVSFCRIIVQTITRTQRGREQACICYSVFVGGGVGDRTEGQECPLKGQTHRPNACLFDLMDCSNDLARRDVIRSFLTIFFLFFLFLFPIFIPFRLLIRGRC